MIFVKRLVNVKRDWKLSAFMGLIILLILVSLACSQLPRGAGETWKVSTPGAAQTAQAKRQQQDAAAATALPMDKPAWTPTPDMPRLLPTLRSEPEEYIVRPNDTLAKIAGLYQVSVEEIVKANDLPNPDLLEIGQVLVIPAPLPGLPGSAMKIIPDSELVFSPGTVGFDTQAFVASQGGYLAGYQEEVEGELYSGAQVVERIARDYSVNPRLLLAILEYRSGWVTQVKPDEATHEYPVQSSEPWRKGLYLQLAWTANQLNRGYYLWRVNAIGAFPLKNGEFVPADATLNAGTAGVQYLFGLLYERAEWDVAVSAAGLQRVYTQLFGYPFLFTFEPLLPADLTQPSMQLPFEPGRQWAFTGGPHGGWGDGSAWAALDFAPPGGALGCVQSDEWVTAVADGLIVRAGLGAVIQDLDTAGNTADGLEQTGWVVLYMHIETRDRVQAGAYLKAGERIGHPSCEGGFSSGTHVHLARRYNGEWIPADQSLPFTLDGWVSLGGGKEYDGFLQKGDVQIEAWEGYFPYNMIGR